MSENVLPDSRLNDRNLTTVMADWPLVGGGTVRCEVAPVFCASCGKHGAWAPLDNMTYLFYMCNQCFEKYPLLPGTFAVPDEQFCKDVSFEMRERFGRDLTELEVAALADQGKLGTALEKLEKESPYALPNPIVMEDR